MPETPAQSRMKRRRWARRIDPHGDWLYLCPVLFFGLVWLGVMYVVLET